MKKLYYLSAACIASFRAESKDNPPALYALLIFLYKTRNWIAVTVQQTAAQVHRMAATNLSSVYIAIALIIPPDPDLKNERK